MLVLAPAVTVALDGMKIMILVLLCHDGISHESLQNYYIGDKELNTESVAEDVSYTTDESKRVIDMSKSRKKEHDNAEYKTNRVNDSAKSTNARKPQFSGNGFRYFPCLSPPDELVRGEADGKRPPIDVRQRVKPKREITPSYSISSDKYHVNISCHVALKRSCALPDTAFIFKQIPFNDEDDMVANSAGTEDVMELLTFQDATPSGVTVKLLHNARDKHREVNGVENVNNFVAKDALAFESSRVTKAWGEHGRAGPVIAGDASLSPDEALDVRNLRRRRSPHWFFPYKQAIFDSGRLMTKYRALTRNAKFSLWHRNEKNESGVSNSIVITGVKKNTSLNDYISKPIPHKGHLCHYHYKNHEDRKSHRFPKCTHATKSPQCPVSHNASATSAHSTKEEETVESTVTPSNLLPDTVNMAVQNVTHAVDAEGTSKAAVNFHPSRSMGNIHIRT